MCTFIYVYIFICIYIHIYVFIGPTVRPTTGKGGRARSTSIDNQNAMNNEVSNGDYV
jgi:hypothetical protein